MANKTAFFKGYSITANTIKDLYTRMNTLRSWAGVATVTVPSPSGSITPAVGATNVFSTVSDTKSKVGFLSGVNIASFAPSASAGASIFAPTSIARLEKVVGLMEQACRSNCVNFFASVFSGNHANFRQTNHASVNSTVHSGKHGTFFASHAAKYCPSWHCTSFGISCFRHDGTNYNGFNITVHSKKNGSTFTATTKTNNFAADHASKQVTVHATNCSGNNSANFNTVHGTFRVEGIDF